MPDDVKALFAEQAQADGKTGWKLNLQAPSFLPVMQFCANRGLREEMYRAYTTRASEFGPTELDNTSLIARILELRQEAVHLLGFDTYAQVSLEPKMAETPQEVMDFLNELARRGILEPGSELYGKALENWVFHELSAHRAYSGRWYDLACWRLAGGTEVDFVVKDVEVAIEVKTRAVVPKAGRVHCRPRARLAELGILRSAGSQRLQPTQRLAQAGRHGQSMGSRLQITRCEIRWSKALRA